MIIKKGTTNFIFTACQDDYHKIQLPISWDNYIITLLKYWLKYCYNIMIKANFLAMILYYYFLLDQC